MSVAEPLLVLRGDAGSTIGIGHGMRLIALGQAWIDSGGRATWLVAEAPPALIERSARAEITIDRSDVTPGSSADARALLARLAADPTSAAVVDGPSFGLAYFEGLAPLASRLTLIDVARSWLHAEKVRAPLKAFD